MPVRPTSRLHLRSPPPSSEHNDAPFCQVASTLPVGVRGAAEAGRFPTHTQPAPVRVVVRSAGKCNSRHCGIKTASTRKTTPERNKDASRGDAEQRAAGEVSTPVGVGEDGGRAHFPLRSAPNRLCARRELRWHTGTCPAVNESEVDQHWHGHPLAEDQSPANGACCALVVRKRSSERKKERKKKLQLVIETKKVSGRWESCSSIRGKQLD